MPLELVAMSSRRVLTLTVHGALTLLAVGRLRVAAVRRLHLTILLRIGHRVGLLRSILTLVLRVGSLITDRWKGRTASILLIARLGDMLRIGTLVVDLLSLLSSLRLASTLIFGLADGLFLLLASLPFLADLLELCAQTSVKFQIPSEDM
jgi:hypothetical protein